MHVCPNCGYCPHCGRGGVPRWPRPWVVPIEPRPLVPLVPVVPVGILERDAVSVARDAILA